MKTFVSRLFNRAPASSGTRAKRPAGRDNPATIEDGSDNATRRHLVQVLLRDLLRNSGIPAAWIDSRMLLVSSKSRGDGMYVRLIVKHWDSRFMEHAYAFEQTLLADIERFEANSGKWLHGISWQFDLGDSCPFTSLPPKAYWRRPASIPPAAMAAPDAILPDAAIEAPAAALDADDVQENDPTADLERLFAIRDQEIERQNLQGLPSVGYEKTQAAPL
jgi:hypothetical protein